MMYAGNNAAAQNTYQGSSALGMQANTPVPRTIASAIGRVDGLNDRLSKARSDLASISDQIGGPRPIESNNKNGSDACQSPSAVARLNDSADIAHEYLTEIESFLGSIARALG